MNGSAEVTTCLTERLAEPGSSNAAFETQEEQMNWVFGDPDSHEGFMRNPKAALEHDILSRDRGTLIHPGVTVPAVDEHQLRLMVHLQVGGSLPLNATHRARGIDIQNSCHPFWPLCIY